MTEKEARDFIELSEKYNRSFIDVNGHDTSYSIKMQDGYISIERNDGCVINASFSNITKYPVNIDYDKNITSILIVVGIDYAGEWHGWKMYVRCADVSPIRQQREMRETQHIINYKKLLIDNADRLNELHNRKLFAVKELPNAKTTYEDMHLEFYTKFTEEERKRQFCHLKEWRDYITRLTNAIYEYDIFCDELWQIAGEGLEY